VLRLHFGRGRRTHMVLVPSRPTVQRRRMLASCEKLSARAMTYSNLMTDGEFDAFWYRLDSRYTSPTDFVVEADSVSEAEALVVSMLARGCDFQVVSVSSRSPSKGLAKKSAARRCGACVACNARDCGVCKNCRDKPRFGGPGIKKKACVARICRNVAAMTSIDGDDDAQGDGEEAEEQHSQHDEAVRGPETLALAQKFHIDVGLAEAVSLDSVADACKRQPLTPLQGSDMRARTALQTVPC